MRFPLDYQGPNYNRALFIVYVLQNGWEQSCGNGFCSFVPSFCLAQMNRKMPHVDWYGFSAEHPSGCAAYSAAGQNRGASCEIRDWHGLPVQQP